MMVNVHFGAFLRVVYDLKNLTVTQHQPKNNNRTRAYEKNEKWFIAYSSSMLDCTGDVKTLKH